MFNELSSIIVTACLTRLIAGGLPSVVRGAATAAADANDWDDFVTAMDWLYEDDDDDDDPSPDRMMFTDVRMTGFLEKLNSMRRKYRESRRRVKHNYRPAPFATDQEYPYRTRPPTPAVYRKTGGQDSGSWPGAPSVVYGATTTVVGNSGDGLIGIGRKGSIAETVERTAEPQPTTPNSTGMGGETGRQRSAAVATADRWYLRMGWQSARCLWRQYRRLKAGAEEQVDWQSVRERFERFARFWTTVVGVSVFLLWSVFGFNHELFCACVPAQPAAYAKDVNKYLLVVPPHVVVTNRGKMFRYRPTVEERFLWEKAKKMANFKI